MSTGGLLAAVMTYEQMKNATISSMPPDMKMINRGMR